MIASVISVMSEEGYRAGEVTSVTGMSYQTLHLWARSGFIEPSIVQSAGRGSERIYSLQDLVALRIARDLRRGGVSTRSLKTIITSLRQLPELQNPQTKAQLFIAGSDVLMINSSQELTSILRKPGQGCLAFVLDIEEACKGLIEEPKRPRAARKHPYLFPGVEGYTAKQVSKLTGVSYQTLHLWAQSEVIQPSIVPATGRGSERVYSHQDLVALRVAAELRRKGISTRAMKEMIKPLRQLRECDTSQTMRRLVIVGSGLLTVDADNKPINALRRPGQGCLALVVDLEQTLNDFVETAKRVRTAKRGPTRASSLADTQEVERMPKFLQGK